MTPLPDPGLRRLLWAFGSTPMPVLGLRALAAVAVVSLLGAVAPLLWAAAAGGLGLLALGALVLAALATVRALPWWLQRLENRLLRSRKSEAAAHPIEQLQNDCLRRAERLLSFREALVDIRAQIASLEDMIATRRLADPAHPLERQVRVVEHMEAFYELNLHRLEEAQAALAAFREQVAQRVFEWEFARQADRIQQAVRPDTVDELLQGLLTDDALRAVQQRFNRVFAELDVQMRTMDAPLRSRRPDAALPPLAVPTRSRRVH